jgi:hypothetical protein
MALNMNLSDITAYSPQYESVTGRRRKNPYQAVLSGQGPSLREAARNRVLDSLQEKNLNLTEKGLDQTAKNFDDTQALEREKLAIAESQAGKAATMQGLQTALTGAYVADKAGIINLKDISGSVLGGIKKLWPGTTTTAPVLETGAGAGTTLATGATETGAGEGATAGATSSYGTVAPVLAFIAAGNLARQQGGSKNVPQNDRTFMQHFTADPLSGPPAYAANKVFGDSNEITKVANAVEKSKEVVFAEPIESFFNGDIAGGIGQVLAAPWEAPRQAIGTVICTELHRQGFLSDAVYEGDARYRREKITDDQYSGYRHMADPIVRLMQRSSPFTRTIAPAAIAVATEMASRVDPAIRGNAFGKLVLALCLPICGAVGKAYGKWNFIQEVTR